MNEWLKKVLKTAKRQDNRNPENAAGFFAVGGGANAQNISTTQLAKRNWTHKNAAVL